MNCKRRLLSDPPDVIVLPLRVFSEDNRFPAASYFSFVTVVSPFWVTVVIVSLTPFLMTVWEDDDEYPPPVGNDDGPAGNEANGSIIPILGPIILDCEVKNGSLNGLEKWVGCWWWKAACPPKGSWSPKKDRKSSKGSWNAPLPKFELKSVEKNGSTPCPPLLSNILLRCSSPRIWYASETSLKRSLASGEFPFLSGWNRNASVLYAFLISSPVAVFGSLYLTEKGAD